MAFMIKMDRVGTDFGEAIDDMREKLGGNAHALFLHIGSGEK
jgi:elongation factor G